MGWIPVWDKWKGCGRKTDFKHAQMETWFDPREEREAKIAVISIPASERRVQTSRDVSMPTDRQHHCCRWASGRKQTSELVSVEKHKNTGVWMLNSIIGHIYNFCYKICFQFFFQENFTTWKIFSNVRWVEIIYASASYIIYNNKTSRDGFLYNYLISYCRCWGDFNDHIVTFNIVYIHLQVQLGTIHSIVVEKQA